MNAAPPVAGSANRYGALRRFALRQPVEYCNLCQSGIGPQHGHLLDTASRQILCACSACPEKFGGLYRPIPTRVQHLDQFHLTDAQWEGLMIPINMAFFVRTDAGTTAVYPSPAGPIESPMPADQWGAIEKNSSQLQRMDSDVEALLVNRLGAARGHEGESYYIVPIDECFRLAGLVRTHWRGLSGGTEVWRAIGLFFAEMKERSCRE